VAKCLETLPLPLSGATSFYIKTISKFCVQSHNERPPRFAVAGRLSATIYWRKIAFRLSYSGSGTLIVYKLNAKDAVIEMKTGRRHSAGFVSGCDRRNSYDATITRVLFGNWFVFLQLQQISNPIVSIITPQLMPS
jgi:hypothetical protein